MKIRHLSAILLSAALFTAISQAATLVVTVNVDNSLGGLFVSNLNTRLTAGNLATAHDGDVIQLGYFDSATQASPFAGNWIPMSGEGSLNTAFNNTTVGDNVGTGSGNGQFAFSLNFTVGSPTTGVSMPPVVGTPLGIRFYNGLNIAQSTLFETIVNPTLWKWPTPAAAPTIPTIDMFLEDAGAKLQSTGLAAPTSGNLNTIIPNVGAPEPTSAALLLVGLVSLASRRRRKV